MITISSSFESFIMLRFTGIEEIPTNGSRLHLALDAEMGAPAGRQRRASSRSG
jgi:hypothetical protein